MPIKLITGTPGAGKTLTALQDALTQVGVTFTGSGHPLERWDDGQEPHVPNRPVYFCNVRGLDKRLPTIESPWQWEDLPDGSLIVVDEAWEFFGKQLRNNDDPRILNLAKHRHRGFDFIFTTQAPSQLAPFVRDLVGAHVHVTRKFGTETTIRYEWPHVQESPNGQTAKSNAIEAIWRYPHNIFSLYESATLHTVKRKLPAKIILVICIAIAVPFLGIGAVWSLSSTFSDTTALVDPASASAGEARSVASTEPSADLPDDTLTPAQFLAMRTPRFEADPASAPMYDQFKVQDYPRMFCVISGNQAIERISCRCRTQQMTPIIVNDRVCIRIARDGYWDPRLRPVGNAPRERSEPERDQAQPDQARSIRAPVGVGGFDRSLNLPYVPPDAFIAGQ